MAPTLEPLHTIGLEPCDGCTGLVVYAIDDLSGRWLSFDPVVTTAGLHVIGLEVDGLGDPPVLELRARVASDTDPRGQRWLLHNCAGDRKAA